MTPQLQRLGNYLAGEFENKDQAVAKPLWYVHIRLWLRPVPLFKSDSLTLFAEQASIIKLDRPYRPRLLRLRQDDSGSIEVQHYMFSDISAVQGAGSNPEILARIDEGQVHLLPGCTLGVTQWETGFKAMPKSNDKCTFTYGGQTFQVALGFEVGDGQLNTYDKGINPVTGQAIWGALMGPYCYKKQKDFSGEFPRD
ncbi:MAG: Phycocyanobilin lyase CpcT [Chroococcopsis gigantea SAG 12.99]|jgi:hypothetical protein|nr:Phycocyanobilin lyase CpcT [Chroococcopsis gigantea SAG 12.99]